MSEFVFKVPSTAKVIWREGHSLRVSRLEEPRIKLATPVYKAGGLSTTPLRRLVYVDTYN